MAEVSPNEICLESPSPTCQLSALRKILSQFPLGTGGVGEGVCACFGGRELNDEIPNSCQVSPNHCEVQSSRKRGGTAQVSRHRNPVKVKSWEKTCKFQNTDKIRAQGQGHPRVRLGERFRFERVVSPPISDALFDFTDVAIRGLGTPRL